MKAPTLAEIKDWPDTVDELRLAGTCPKCSASREGVNVPTLDEIRRWPATVDVPTAGAVFGLSRSHSYESFKRGDFPAKVIKVGSRYRVITASIVRVLSEEAA